MSHVLPKLQPSRAGADDAVAVVVTQVRRRWIRLRCCAAHQQPVDCKRRDAPACRLPRRAAPHSHPTAGAPQARAPPEHSVPPGRRLAVSRRRRARHRTDLSCCRRPDRGQLSQSLRVHQCAVTWALSMSFWELPLVWRGGWTVAPGCGVQRPGSSVQPGASRGTPRQKAGGGGARCGGPASQRRLPRLAAVDDVGVRSDIILPAWRSYRRGLFR